MPKRAAPSSKPKLTKPKLTKPKPTSAQNPSTLTSVPSSSTHKRYWLIKSEPDAFSIDDLAQAKHQTTYWDGVRNYQARNTLRDLMQLGDVLLYYHSNTEEPAIVGLAEVARTGYPDFTAWDPKDAHYDPKTDRNNPRWYMIDVKFVKKFPQPLTLAALRQVKGLESMVLLQKGSRLSVQPVRPEEFAIVLRLAGAESV